MSLQLTSSLCLLALLGDFSIASSVGKNPGGRIHSGIVTRKGDLPFVLKLEGNKGTILLKKVTTCSSFLIHPRWLLTAAHCKIDGYAYKIFVNSLPETGETTIDLAETDWIEHPVYRVNSTYQNYTADLALIHVGRDIPVTPIRIANFSTDPFPYLKNIRGAMVTPAGYGYVGQGGIKGKQVRKTYMFLEPECPISVCPDYCSPYSGDKEPMFCVSGGPGIEGICKGDSGGPVLFEELKSRIAFGINSSTSYSGCSSDPERGPWNEVNWAIRISFHLEWIQKKMCEKGDRLDYMDYQCP